VTATGMDLLRVMISKSLEDALRRARG